MTAPTSPQLFDSYLQPVLNTAYGTAMYLTRNREDAEDLVQDAAVRAFRSFHTFEPGTNFKAWFLRILTNLFLNQCRKQSRRPELVQWEEAADAYLSANAVERDRMAQEAEPATRLLQKMTRQQINAAFAQLPDEYRTVCALYFMDEFSYQEIAEMVGCPLGTVRSRLHRGRKVLQQLLSDMVNGDSAPPTEARPTVARHTPRLSALSACSVTA